VAETSDVMAALATDLPPAEPSPDLRNRLRAAVERTEQVPRALSDLDDLDGLDGLDEPADPAPDLPDVPLGAPRAASGFPLRQPLRREIPSSRPPWRRALPSALVAAAVAAVLGLGTWNVMLAESRNEARTQAVAQAEMLDSLLRPGQATIATLEAPEGGERVATIVARDDSVAVVAEGLPVNQVAQTTYVVWGMRDDVPVPLGTFDVERSQTELRPVVSEGTGLDDYAGYAVSIEPGRTMPDEPTKVVAKG
jgi:Anti-sigma-K factor rskA